MRSAGASGWTWPARPGYPDARRPLRRVAALPAGGRGAARDRRWPSRQVRSRRSTGRPRAREPPIRRWKRLTPAGIWRPSGGSRPRSAAPDTWSRPSRQRYGHWTGLRHSRMGRFWPSTLATMADTTGAVYGQLAGALCGEGAFLRTGGGRSRSGSTFVRWRIGSSRSPRPAASVGTRAARETDLSVQQELLRALDPEDILGPLDRRSRRPPASPRTPRRWPYERGRRPGAQCRGRSGSPRGRRSA